MTTLREAAQKALDAFDRSHALKLKPLHLAERMDALRAALAEPAPEAQPVAWIQPDHLNKARAAPFLCRVEPTQRLADLVPIYTHPPRPALPRLTPRELRDAVCECADEYGDGTLDDRYRAIESAVRRQLGVE